MDSDRGFLLYNIKKIEFFQLHPSVKQLEKHGLESKLTFATGKSKFWYKIFECAHFDAKLIIKQLYALT